MVQKRIKSSLLIENNLPTFVREDYPLVAEFLSEYYKALEIPGGPEDLIQNLDQHIKVDGLANLVLETTLGSDIEAYETSIFVTSTEGFPKTNGLIQIESEIVFYQSKTSTTFDGCIRGFSGISSYRDSFEEDQLVFSETIASQHSSGSTVLNLSVLFLKEYLNKLKKQVVPGLDGIDLFDGLNEATFIKQSSDFYKSKGTEESYNILFKALFGKKAQVIRPRDYLILPSSAEYDLSRKIVVEEIEGNAYDLANRTLFQDEVYGIEYASSPVVNVEKIFRGEKEYFILTLDYTTNSGDAISPYNFTVHQKTFNTTKVSAGSSIITVDSTVGFPESGEIYVNEFLTFSYNGKSVNQFFNCSGISLDLDYNTELKLNVFAYAYGPNNTVIRVRVGGTLSLHSNFNDFNRSFLNRPGDPIVIESLGITTSNPRTTSWILNIPIKYNVKTLESGGGPLKYKITTFGENNIVDKDDVEMEVDEVDSNGTVNRVIKTLRAQKSTIKKSFIVQSDTTINKVYWIRRKILKYPQTDYFANVQNIYTGKNNDFGVYVTSNSLPNYFQNIPILKSTTRNFSGNYNGEEIINSPSHGFLTGESVRYIPSSSTEVLNSNITYYVQKVDIDNFKLSTSRSNIFSNKFVQLYGNVSNDRLETLKFYNKVLEPQNLVRRIPPPKDYNGIYETPPGFNGIFSNGVEILNYKSPDSIFYGEIESIEVLSEGDNYQIINQSPLVVTDVSGIGFTGFCEIEGSLDRIEIIDPGFGIIESDIELKIVGGNGSGCELRPIIKRITHVAEFSAEQSANLIDIANNKIGFTTYHKFYSGEEIVYEDSVSEIGGLVNFSRYYVNAIDEFNVSLHAKESDAISGINTISLTSYSTGNHRLVSVEGKNIVSSVEILQTGTGYKSKKTSAKSEDIDLTSNLIKIKNNGYNSGEKIIYQSSTGSAISGLTTGTEYIVRNIDKDNFLLYQVGDDIQGELFYYNAELEVQLTSKGSGEHFFDYPPIELVVNTISGFSTARNSYYSPVIRPIFKGKIKSVFVSSGGVGYGSSEIINFDRQPNYEFVNGSGAYLNPIISGGRIVDITIPFKGINYTSIPELKVVSKTGSGAVLTPIIENGELVDVKIIEGGRGYESNVKIEVIPSGTGCFLKFNIKPWRINLYKKLLDNNLISSDGSILYPALNDNSGLEYTHIYLPEQLRDSVYSVSNQTDSLIYTTDLDNDNTSSPLHSPIVGWAYDGNPIYGPYGYESETSTKVKQIESGYRSISLSNRPSSFPEGFFIDDYFYAGDGDLDENNGRFCKTPEYPNGVYAYFCTFTPQKTPEFPYVMGAKFKSTPREFNYKVDSNQNDFDISINNLLRVTNEYPRFEENSKYEFIIDPDQIRNSFSTIVSTSKDILPGVSLLSGGENYKVGDTIIMRNDLELSYDPVDGVVESPSSYDSTYIKVSSIGGKDVKKISSVSTSDNFEILEYRNGYVAFSTDPHEFLNNDSISISDTIWKNNRYEGNYNTRANIKNEIIILREDIEISSFTGIVTYFNVDLPSYEYQYIRENDVFLIDDEKIKVLNVDKKSSRIRVLRGYDGTDSVAEHTATTRLTPLTRKIYFSDSNYLKGVNKVNKELYFDPSESVGIGTIATPGLGSTISISNPGAGATSIFIKNGRIFLPDHGLLTNTKLVYSTNGGNPITIDNKYIPEYQLENNTEVYAIRFNDNEIGISTNTVGIDTGGNIAGLTTITSLVYFSNSGTGKYHSFKTKYNDVATASISKNEVTVETSDNLNLKVGDTVNVEVLTGISTTFVVKYNDSLRRTLVNPREFDSSDVSSTEDYIIIPNHGYFNGQKVIHTSSSPSGGLLSDEFYYVSVLTSDKIRLCENRYNSILPSPVYVNITSESSGTISPINPKLEAFKYNKVIFDLSDSSLSFLNGSRFDAAFDFDLYYDADFRDTFVSTKTTQTFEVLKTGTIGVDANAKVEITLNENVPKKLFYKLTPIKYSNTPLPQTKKNIVVENDSENTDDNSSCLVVSNSKYAGNHILVEVNTNSFVYSLNQTPEISEYTNLSSNITYTTSSNSEVGPIVGTQKVFDSKLSRHPFLDRVITENGKNALVKPEKTVNIGTPQRVKIVEIGADYPSDPTLAPVTRYPDLIDVTPVSIFDRIGINSIGKNYLVPPNLVVLDGFRNTIIDDVDLAYEFGDTEVTIRKNSRGFYFAIPKIIPINNSNGIGINSAIFDPITKTVFVEFDKVFEKLEDFPFEENEKILVENVLFVENFIDDFKGFNSSDYNYELFTITEVDPKIGQFGASIRYSLDGIIDDGEETGPYDFSNPFGRVIPEKYFPSFDISIKKRTFFEGERVTAGPEAEGIVLSWDARNEFLRVSTTDHFLAGIEVRGDTSGTRGIIGGTDEFRGLYTTQAYTITSTGWEKDTGKLSQSNQRLHDNDYYQYFSYSVKSEVSSDKWDDYAANLNHTAGFKRFSDLQIESEYSVGISTFQRESLILAQIDSAESVNCYYDYDLAFEETARVSGQLISNQIVLKSRRVQDYFECFGNRVLTVDDISSEFNHYPKSERYSVVDSFDVTSSQSKKYLTFVRDVRFTSERQVLLVTLLQNGLDSYLNQYGRIETYQDLGSFDFNIFGSEGSLLFYPTNFRVNDYDISYISYDIRKDLTTDGEENIGDICVVNSGISTVSSGQTTTIFEISDSYRASKIIVEHKTQNGSFEFDELTVIHDGSNVEILEFGQLSDHSSNEFSSNGFGTYDALIDNSMLKINFSPNTTQNIETNYISISISDDSLTGVGSTSLNNGLIESSYTSIASTSSPTTNIISQYNVSDYNGSYLIVVVEDITNSTYQISEFMMSHVDLNSSAVEFGALSTNTEIQIGEFSSEVSGGFNKLLFTPEQNIETRVRVFQNMIGILQNLETSSIDI